ncbi:hypothetical protein LX15_003329 [Streptoalloteichus tenebrarius]|uniref:Uncharacterized protein n=1 Tax=Streptoalloteichus tenebrarius (strain ATCC 17920 / DSM 40477 / JCM 4838 / CBS 697.72 / NBRC 16177 / NCIMB 11028 / NRRL B-12390 / A12253. 1 / ISP 5477) TaxID=1933 RepID=A0ABT1HVS2_STRSD|nr:hypothetical protein [Streptoalloteichus tenebrarius]MCP2259624.1 hypothetical protein [Streptoalloteichus tenebrarius]BFF00970.1 hypothetical protein GCM10020241_26450 [Streptoalloteichus tenebrarius]
MPLAQNWPLDSPPGIKVAVAQELVELRAPLVNVSRDDEGDWTFRGPGAGDDQVTAMTLADVVNAWPHVASLDELRPGAVALWDWAGNGWQIGFPVSTAPPKAVDLDEDRWPLLGPDSHAVVERAVVTGERPLTDIQRDEEGFSYVGPEQTAEPNPEDYLLVPLADAVRRWPHSLPVVLALEPGEGVEWHHDAQQWESYRFTRG